MKLMVLGSGDLLIELIERCQRCYPQIEIISVCNLHIREEVIKETASKLDRLNVNRVELSGDELDKADLILSFNCSVILPYDVVDVYDIINMHVGILPKYRGNSANTWAIMNGEDEVGFTIHKMSRMLDEGDIYFVKKIPILYNQTYSDVYDELMASIIDETPRVLTGIYRGDIHARKQCGAFAYTTLFSASMGHIKDYNISADYIYNLFRCMAKPHGSGIYFYKNNVRYEAGKVLRGKDRGVIDYVGIPGKIVYVYDESIWVKTADNVVVFEDIKDENGNRVKTSEIFKNGQKLDSK